MNAVRLASILLALLLAACGGGGGSSAVTGPAGPLQRVSAADAAAVTAALVETLDTTRTATRTTFFLGDADGNPTENLLQIAKWHADGTTDQIDELTKGAGAGSLGAWVGTRYSSDNGEAVVYAKKTSPASDTQYTYFGWWLVNDDSGVPEDAGGYMSWAGGGTIETNPQSEDIRPLEGTVTYSGFAAGYFAVTAPGSEYAGSFTASVALNANFGDATEAGSLSGTIDNFKSNGREIPGGWVIIFEPDDFGRGGALTDGVGSIVWTVDGVAFPVTGDWHAYSLDRTKSDSELRPDEIVGHFHARHSGTHRMVGGFATTRD